ncbi:MAG TPA: hypothetical protein PK198_14435 [Saprospiraceae bacterium]|nr:hypothetical protein [Saprospiraceae bacterium]HRJ13783.1 hypothetical protein [Saprospiraceae bacterium]HRK82614.1 hypothetical protein [Saprospiraceae bacterium]
MEDQLKHIKQQAESYRMQPSQQAWERLERRLGEQPKSAVVRRLSLRHWAAAASVLGMAAIAALLLLRPDNSAQPESAAVMEMQQAPELEMLDMTNTDEVALMAVNYTRFLERNHPEMMRDF